MLDVDAEDSYVASTTLSGLITNNGEIENTTNVVVPTNASWPDYNSVCSSGASENFLSTTLFQTCVFIMYSIVFVVALIGNGLVCFVVRSSPRMKTVTNYFIVNLSVGDILMTLFCVPFSFISMLIMRYWPFGGIMCKVVNYSQAVSVLVSAYTLLAISIDRYMVIMHPLRPRLGKTAAKLVVAGVWGGALATAAPIPIVSQVQRPTEWHQYCEVDICLEEWERPEQSEQYTCALLALQFLLPLSALVCTYVRIAHVVWGGRPPGEAESTRDSRMQRSKRKMIKMMVTVVAVFTVCWLPLNVFIETKDNKTWRQVVLRIHLHSVGWDENFKTYKQRLEIYLAATGLDEAKEKRKILWTVYGEDASWATWPGMSYVWFASHWLAMSHCCYNPIIYCYMNARYRRGFKQALGWIFMSRMEPPSQSYHGYSVGDNIIPMSELVGVNGIARRGTNSSCLSRLHRAPTCSSCTSIRRGPTSTSAVHRTNVPVRALSVRTHFN